MKTSLLLLLTLSAFITGVHAQDLSALMGADGIPGIPVLVSPENGAINVDTSTSLRWQSVPGAFSYSVEIYERSRNDSIRIAHVSGIPGTSLSFDSFELATEYGWRVRAENADGVGAWSQVWTFRTPDLPAEPPVLLAPGEGAAYIRNVDFIWTPGQYARSSRLQVATDSTFQSIVVDSSGLIYGAYGLILPGRPKYYWRVASVNSLGEVWSSFKSFGVFPEPPSTAPEPLFPLDGTVIESDTVVLEWSTVPDATSYTIELAHSPSFENTLSPRIPRDPRDTTSAISGRELEAGTFYYWRVQARNPSGRSEWSELGAFNYLGGGTPTEEEGPPIVTRLRPLYPNPSKGGVNIAFDVSTPSHVTIALYDMTGRLLETVVDEQYQRGRYEASWNAAPQPGGVYLCRMQAGPVTDTQKIVVVH
ncbi:MAG TPA: T9SS type A sorting domain-containing protein [Rhodothermales bacterium]|nr:T9SS type A sorting domain-containing protein [Rhodothermales bacterium]